MPTDEFADLLSLQSGIISRRQALGAGLEPHDIRRLRRRRELVDVHPGVFVNHTGDLTWPQRAWAGVQYAWPAALAHESAIRAADGPGRRDQDLRVIHVAVDRERKLHLPPGLRLHRLAGLAVKTQWNASPPRLRIEEAVIDVAAESISDFDAIARLADAVQSRRTTAQRLRGVLDRRSRIARRQFLGEVLDDVGDGTCSVLEHGYLNRVERPHGLPSASRQVRASSRGPIYRDVCYVDQAQVVELDGRLGHDSAADRDADLERDLDAAVDRQHTVRIGWGQVFRTGCRTGARIGRLLNARGWTGAVTPCPDCQQGWPVAS